MNYINNFIIIDDDKVNNKVCTKILEQMYPKAGIVDFLEARKGLDYIAEKFTQNENERAVLLLDIIMPVMNAWDFLEEFEKLSESIKSRIKIYILSSSVDKNDMAKAHANKYVEYYLIKPLTKESIHLIVHVLEKRLAAAGSK